MKEEYRRRIADGLLDQVETAARRRRTGCGHWGGILAQAQHPYSRSKKIRGRRPRFQASGRYQSPTKFTSYIGRLEGLRLGLGGTSRGLTKT